MRNLLTVMAWSALGTMLCAFISWIASLSSEAQALAMGVVMGILVVAVPVATMRRDTVPYWKGFWDGYWDGYWDASNPEQFEERWKEGSGGNGQENTQLLQNDGVAALGRDCGKT